MNECRERESTLTLTKGAWQKDDKESSEALLLKCFFLSKIHESLYDNISSYE